MSVLRKLRISWLLTAVVAATVSSAQTPAPATPSLPPGPAKPSLVVVISVDQMRADYLDRFRPWFGKDGFNRFLDRGAVWPEARQRHSATFTCPGHASIGTGLDPRHTGIVANRWYDVVAGAGVYCVEDRRTAWVGAGENPPKTSAQPASPLQMTGDSLGDRLKEKYPGSRVVGVALKDRASVLMAGRKADAAVWFEEKFGRFVTSTYYPPRPSLLAIDDSLPAFFADPAHQEWKLSDRIPKADLDRITVVPPTGSTGQPAGYGPEFPHTLPKAFEIVHSPWGDELVLDLARRAVADFGLGSAAGRPDLLFVGLSSTDYYGHWFGPDSKEIADGIVLLDERLQRFFGWLDERVGKDRVLVFLTADHGVQSIPQVARARKARDGREDPAVAGRVDLSNGRDTGEFPLVRELSPDRVELERALAKKFGYSLDVSARAIAEAAVVFFEEPCLYVNRGVLARRRVDPEAVKAAVRDWVRARPGVAGAWTSTEIADGLPATAPHGLAIERSFRADRSGDVFMVLKPGWMWSYGRDTGTTHGQPVDDDARVPLLAWGPGVKAGSYRGEVSPISIARTVAELFGFDAGEPDAPVLAPVLGRESGTKKLMGENR